MDLKKFLRLKRDDHDLDERLHETSAADPAAAATAQAGVDDELRENTGLDHSEGRSLIEAAGQALATAQDPLNKALRGIGDHLQHKIGDLQHEAGQQDSFYQRLGIDTPQMDQHQSSHENDGPELDL